MKIMKSLPWALLLAVALPSQVRAQTCGSSFNPAVQTLTAGECQPTTVFVNNSYAGEPDVYFEIFANGGDTIMISTCGLTVDDTSLVILDDSRNQLACCDDCGPCGVHAEMSHTFSSTGTYLIRPGTFGGNPGDNTFVYCWGLDCVIDGVCTPRGTGGTSLPTPAPTAATVTRSPTPRPTASSYTCGSSNDPNVIPLNFAQCTPESVPVNALWFSEPDVYYEFQADAGDVMMVSSCGLTSGDTSMSILDGNRNELTCCDDCGPCGVQTEIEYLFPSTGTYMIRAGSWSGQRITNTFQYCWGSGCLVNGDCTAAPEAPTFSPAPSTSSPTPAPTPQPSAAGNTCGSSSDPLVIPLNFDQCVPESVPVNALWFSEPDVYYEFQADAGDVMMVSSCHLTEDDTSLSILDANRNELYCCDDCGPCSVVDVQTEIEYQFPSTGTYMIRAGSWSGRRITNTFQYCWGSGCLVNGTCIEESEAPSSSPTAMPTVAQLTEAPTVDCQPCYDNCLRDGLRCGRRCDEDTACEDDCRRDYRHCTSVCDDTECSGILPTEAPTYAPTAGPGTCGSVCETDCEDAGRQCGRACNGRDTDCKGACRSDAANCIANCPPCPASPEPTIAPTADLCETCDDQCRSDGRACGRACNDDAACEIDCRADARRCISNCPCPEN